MPKHNDIPEEQEDDIQFRPSITQAFHYSLSNSTGPSTVSGTAEKQPSSESSWRSVTKEERRFRKTISNVEKE